MVEQVHYSIDREPVICARVIAQVIRAGGKQPGNKRPVFNQEPTFEETWGKLREAFEQVQERLMYQMMGR